MTPAQPLSQRVQEGEGGTHSRGPAELRLRPGSSARGGRPLVLGYVLQLKESLKLYVLQF